MALSVNDDTDSNGFACYWRIENFHLKPCNNFSIKSPSFEINTLESKWYLEIAEENGFLGVFLFKADDPKYCMTKICISLLMSTDWVPVLETPNYRYRNKSDSGYGMFKVLSLKKLAENPWIHLPNGSLTISFHIRSSNLGFENSQCLMVSRIVNENEMLHRPIEFFSNLKPSDLLSFSPSYKFQSDELPFNASNKNSKEIQTQTDTTPDLNSGNELLNLLKENKFSFVTLRTPDKEFVVHKAILCANSPVFNAMFESQMEDNECNTVDIDDIDGQSMISLIRYFHYQPLSDLNWDTAVTLYYASNKYQMNLLKKECVLHLKNGLSVENVCDAFLLADLHDDEDLMSWAHEYFSKNLKLIFTSTHWKDFLCHTELVAKILHKLGEHMGNNILQ